MLDKIKDLPTAGLVFTGKEDHTEDSSVPSPLDVERYKRLRLAAKELNHRLTKTIPREGFSEIGEAIGILHDGVFVFDTEDVTSVLMDCCLYD